MRRIIFTLLAICCFLNIQAQLISGVVTDDKDNPLPFATVAIVNTKDTTCVAGSVTDDSGNFNIEVTDENAILRVSMVGYETQILIKPFPKHIKLKLSSQDLGEVVVKAARQFVKMTSNGLIVNMEGNPLSKLPSVADAIKQMPMIDPVSGTVLGKGSSVFYINKRKVRDGNEILQLSPEKVKSVEIVTRPGTRYDSDVRSVIIIHTKRLDEGLGGTVSCSGTLAEVLSGGANASLSYMFHNGLGVYGGASVENSGFKQDRTYMEEFNNDVFHNETDGVYKSRTKSLRTDLGTSYDFSTDNSVGVRYMFTRVPDSHYRASGNFVTNALAETSESGTLSKSNSQSYQHAVNAYSCLTFGKKKNFDLAFDADYIYGNNGHASDTEEEQDAILWNMRTENNSSYHIFASKANLSMTFGKLNAEVGVQYSYTKNKMGFGSFGSEDSSFLGQSSDKEKQHLYAGYLILAYNPNENWNINGGLRYENTDFDYEQNGVKVDEQSKMFSDLLPTLGVNYQKGNLGIGLAYETNISRPSYDMLNNNYTYVSHTSWETGNPLLRSSISRSLELSLQWKQTIVMASYNRNKRVMNTVYTYLPAENVNLRQEINLPDYNSYLLIASQSFNIGLWHPMVQGMLLLQNLKYGSDSQSYNKPLGKITLSNRFDLPWSIYAYAGGSWTSKGHQAALYLEGDIYLYVMLNKNVKNWSFNLLLNDVANTYRQKNLTNTNGVSYLEYRKGSSRTVQLSVTYTFKQKKAYKGRQAAKDELDRF